MGILNVTPDSFSDGGRYLEAAEAVEHGLRMVGEGAAIIDVGGESTRPGSEAVGAEEQVRRVVPVIEGLVRQTQVPVSIDTRSAAVAKAAFEAGATIVNDISALRFDAEMAGFAARNELAVILMHMQGSPGDMQRKPRYDDVVGEVKGFLAERIDYAVGAGIGGDRLVVDPGIGFGKTVEHNLLLLKRLAEFGELGVPVLIGPSRKSFIGKVLGLEDPGERLFGTAAVVAMSAVLGAQIIRVHDVGEMSQVVKLAWAISQS